MHITQKTKDHTLQVCVAGRIDIMTAQKLLDALNLENITRVIFDLGGTTYISSAGLRVFLQVYNQLQNHGGRLVVKHPQPMVREVFMEVGFNQLFEMEK